MKFQINPFIIPLLILLIASCSTSTSLIHADKGKNFRIKFFLAYPDRETYPYIYARVDSGNSKVNYYFKTAKIYKLIQQENALIYTLEYKEPEIPFATSDYFSRLFPLDYLVFKKANILLDSLGFKKNIRPDGATGFVIEVLGH